MGLCRILPQPRLQHQLEGVPKLWTKIVQRIQVWVIWYLEPIHEVGSWTFLESCVHPISHTCGENCKQTADNYERWLLGRFRVLKYSVEISWFYYHSDFTWNQCLRFLKCKICHFNTFRGSEFWFLWIFPFFKGRNLTKRQNSEPQKWQKRQF